MVFFSWLRNVPPPRLLALGYLALIALCGGLLHLPWLQNQPDTASLDHWFTAVSVVSTTGLTVVDIDKAYNLGGEILILVFIQIGGLGFMAMASGLLLIGQHRIAHEERQLLEESFSLPEDYDVFTFLRSVLLFSFGVEAVGTAVLYPLFAQAGVESPLWVAFFHSISAFCTAGFSLFGNSLADFADDVALNLVIGVLSLLGAIGFIAITDVYKVLRHRQRGLIFTTRVVLRFTFVTLLVSVVSAFLIEPVQDASDVSPLSVFFHCLSAFTTVGFNTIEFEVLRPGMWLIVAVLMIMGASPSGTGGGIKSTSLVTLLAVAKSRLRGHVRITFLGNRLAPERITLAITNAFVYFTATALGLIGITLLEEDLPMPDLLIETVSALSTVGLSTGITEDLSGGSKGLLMGLMYMGRLGTVVFGLALLEEEEDSPEEKARANEQQEKKEDQQERAPQANDEADDHNLSI